MDKNKISRLFKLHLLGIKTELNDIFEMSRIYFTSGVQEKSNNVKMFLDENKHVNFYIESETLFLDICYYDILEALDKKGTGMIFIGNGESLSDIAKWFTFEMCRNFTNLKFSWVSPYLSNRGFFNGEIFDYDK